MITISSDPEEDILKKCSRFIPNQGDALVIGSAWESKVDYFVTLDRKHFLDNPILRENIPLIMGTPEDFLAWFRVQLLQNYL